MSKSRVIVLDEFIIQKEKGFPNATGQLASLLRDIGIAAKIIHREVNKAGLVDILGETGNNNVHGEAVKKLDMYANEQLISYLSAGSQCAGIASEENEDALIFTDQISKKGKYVVLFDPLDGSSNIDVNVSIGTIFSIYKRESGDGTANLQDFLQKGTEQVAAGYIIYGSSTMLVYTTGYEVNGFTLDPSIGEFCLSHPHIQIPNTGTTYSVNQGYYEKFPTGLKRYIKWVQEVDTATSRPYSQRYIGSMVADVHRTLIKGGVFMYPATISDPKGKLRLMYECNPLSFIIEQAGGKSVDCKGNRIMDIEPTELHQRTPIYMGSPEMVEKIEHFMAEKEVTAG